MEQFFDLGLKIPRFLNSAAVRAKIKNRQLAQRTNKVLNSKTGGNFSNLHGFTWEKIMTKSNVNHFKKSKLVK